MREPRPLQCGWVSSIGRWEGGVAGSWEQAATRNHGAARGSAFRDRRVDNGYYANDPIVQDLPRGRPPKLDAGCNRPLGSAIAAMLGLALPTAVALIRERDDKNDG
jgi:hypothetical protein